MHLPSVSLTKYCPEQLSSICQVSYLSFTSCWRKTERLSSPDFFMKQYIALLNHHTLDEWYLPHCFDFVSFPSQVLFLGQPRKLIRDTASYPHFRELMKVSHHVLRVRGQRGVTPSIIIIMMNHFQMFPLLIMCKLLLVRRH